VADLTDVQDALVALIAAALYPNGTDQPSAVSVPVIVYAGWPQASQLDADLAAIPAGNGRIHVTVFATKTERNTTRYPTTPQDATVVDPTLTLTIAGQTVTIGGTVFTPQNVALLIDKLAYTYAIQANDTLDSIAAALAMQIPGASSAGHVITIASGSIIRAARAGGSGTSISEVRRQMRLFQITIWADTPDNRKAVAKLVDPMLSNQEFITLADGTGARIIYQSSCDDDMPQKANAYRRDLLYQVEYATTLEIDSTQVVVQQENIANAISGAPTITLYE